ncbi:hypothetical protein N2152v2_005488 [Parachlorella kessleri]
MTRRGLLPLVLLGLVVGGSLGYESLSGYVTGAGYYVGCQVAVDLATGYTTSGVSKAGNGSFAVPCSFGDGTSCTGSVLRMPAEQGEGCRDSVTGLPVMFGLKAPLVAPVVAGGDVAVHPVTTLMAVLYQATKGAEWDQIAALVEEQLGLPSVAAAYKAGAAIYGVYNGDILAGVKLGYPASLSFQAANAQLHNLVTIGGSLMAGLLLTDDGPLTYDSIADTLYFSLGLQMAMAARDGTSIDLTNATIVAQTLATAQVSLQKVVDAAAKQAAEAAAASVVASSTPVAVVGSRRLLRAVARFSLLEDANSTQPEDSMDSVTAESVGGERVTVQGTNGTGSSNSTQAGDDYEGDSGDDEYPAEDDDGTVGSQSLDDDPYGDSYGDFNGTSLDHGTVAVSPAMPSPEGAAPSPASLPSPSPAAVGPGPAPLPSPFPQQQQGSPLPSLQPTGSPEPEDDGGLVVDLPDLTEYGKVGTVASPIAILNEFAAGAAAEGLKPGTDPAVVLTVLARVMAVAQMDVAPTARLLGEGDADASEFQAFDVDGLIKLVQSVPLS